MVCNSNDYRVFNRVWRNNRCLIYQSIFENYAQPGDQPGLLLFQLVAGRVEICASCCDVAMTVLILALATWIRIPIVIHVHIRVPLY